MAENHKIKTFTAADIEKYHKRLMSPKERHALEKAALDDPFLADALEGYGSIPVNVNEDIAELKNRIEKRTEKTEVVPVLPSRASSFAWWKVAAMIILVAGAGLLVYQFAFNKKSADIAQAPKDNSIKKIKTTDSGTVSFPSAGLIDSNAEVAAASTNGKEIDKKTSAANKSIPSRETTDGDGRDDALDKVIEKSLASENNEGITKNDDAKATIPAPSQEESKLKNRRNDNAPAPGAFADVQYKKVEANQNATGNAAKPNQGYVNQSNVFRGRVTDNNNNALPFSNITNLQDTIGTYSDARGYFILTSPDSVLNVQVRSLGFETSNVQLNNTKQENKILLEEDKSLSANVLDTVKRNTNRSRNTTMILEEPEPADGWSNYDMYLANNLKVPEAFQTRQSGGTVELSFEVDKNGEPYNIKVKKSLCESCDKEAVRLIKEGPKWKRKTKKGKATVTVTF